MRFDINFREILENLIAGSLGEMNLSEWFEIVFPKLQCYE